MYRIFRSTAKAREGEQRRPPALGAYEWVGDASGFAEGTGLRPEGMSEVESAVRFWHGKQAPVTPGYYVAIAWDSYAIDRQPFGFEVKPEELVVPGASALASPRKDGTSAE